MLTAAAVFTCSHMAARQPNTWHLLFRLSGLVDQKSLLGTFWTRKSSFYHLILSSNVGGLEPIPAKGTGQGTLWTTQQSITEPHIDKNNLPSPLKMFPKH